MLSLIFSVLRASARRFLSFYFFMFRATAVRSVGTMFRMRAAALTATKEFEMPIGTNTSVSCAAAEDGRCNDQQDEALSQKSANSLHFVAPENWASSCRSMSLHCNSSSAACYHKCNMVKELSRCWRQSSQTVLDGKHFLRTMWQIPDNPAEVLTFEIPAGLSLQPTSRKPARFARRRHVAGVFSSCKRTAVSYRRWLPRPDSSCREIDVASADQFYRARLG
jgi:hypothetical protein